MKKLNYVELRDELLRNIKSNDLEVQPMSTDDRYLITDEKGNDVSVSILMITSQLAGDLLQIKFEQPINPEEVDLSSRVMRIYSGFMEHYKNYLKLGGDEW